MNALGKRKSKGNFADFVQDANKNPRLRQKFIESLRKGMTADDLLKLFYSLGYYGVSLDDCITILSTIKDPKKLAEVWNLKY